ncbi:MAG TPA: ubiquinone/menaquinone biosynthesis methyltransferase [Burkholderiales bacterium]|nr:ubiquinone/menaquinone biosynthesis methyltransferase [Burkholderiales bacterium]
MTDGKNVRVRAMFDRIAPRYDLANTILTAGSDKRWRRRAIEQLNPRAGERILDVGCGTAKMLALAARRAAIVPVGVDPAKRMLAIARQTVPSASFALADGEQLPFRSASFDGAMNAFVLRNLESLPTFFAEMQRIVRPGGRVVSLEIAKPTGALYGPAHSLYFGKLVPTLGGFVSGQRSAYAYLAKSVEGFPRPRELCALMEDIGFDVEARPMARGAIYTYVARRER